MNLGGTLQQVLAHFGDVSAGWLVLALAGHLANHGLRSVAWRNVLRAAYPARHVPLVGVACAYAAGVALNGALPGRGGDAAKAGLLRARLPGSSLPTIVSSMSVLVVFDLVAATAIGILILVTGRLPAPPATGAPQWAGSHLPVLAAGALALVAVAVVLARRAGARLRRLWEATRQGGAILRTPGRFLRRVVAVQAGAWVCRIAVVFCLLSAFGIHASVPAAGTVMVLCGASTLIPLTPGGAGTQQVLVVYALGHAGTAAGVLAFSVGMQVGLTAVNAVLGLAGAMVALRTLHPIQALRSGALLAPAAPVES